MAIVSVNEDHRPRGGTRTRTDGRDPSIGLVNEQWQRVFVVVTDDIDDGPRVVSFADGVPQLGDGYPEGGDAAVTNIDPRPIGGDSDAGYTWRVTVTYSELGHDAADPPGGGGDDDDPSNRLSYSTRKKTIVLYKDQVGRPIVNTAGEQFKPLPEVEVSFPAITIQWVASHAQVNAAQALVGLVNDGGMLGFAANRVLLDDFSAQSRHTTAGNVVFDASATFLIDDGWNPLEILNLGTLRGKVVGLDAESPAVDISGSAAELQQILDPNGTPITEPIPLDADGKPILTGGALHYRSFDIYKTGNLGAMHTGGGMPTIAQLI